jgi:hypothetical protein
MLRPYSHVAGDRFLINTYQTTQYVASFLAGGGVSGAGRRSTGCGEMVRGGCLFAWNFSVTWATVLTGTESKALDQT